MSESSYQRKRIQHWEDKGYFVMKLVKTSKNGIPDIIAIPPDSGVVFEEIKGVDGVVSPLQEYMIRELNAHGCIASVEREAKK